jgi:glyoxylase-like metal-dependent hydrolase (beta-lactamase superfamily II)
MAIRGLYVLPNADTQVDQSLFLAGRGMGKKVHAPVLVFFIRADEGNILFDAGCDPDIIRDAQKAWGNAAEYLSVSMKEEGDIRHYLRALNLTPEDVKYLVLSHLHIDHAGALRFFPHSQILVQEDEYRFAYHPSGFAAANYRKADFDYPHLNWKLLDGDFRLFPGATIVLTQGHSPGTQALVLDLPETGTVILAGDSIPLRRNADKGILPGIVWNSDLAMKSIQRLKVIAEERGGTIFPGHDAEHFQGLKKFPDFYR